MTTSCSTKLFSIAFGIFGFNYDGCFSFFSFLSMKTVFFNAFIVLFKI